MEKQEPTKKKDIRSILLIVLFVGLFAFVMGMPYVNEFLDNLKKDAGLDPIEQRAKQVEKQQQQNAKTTKNTSTKKEETKTLTCTGTKEELEGYSKVVVETFEYNNKEQVLVSSKTTTYTFTETNALYEELKSSCDEDGLKYIDKNGYEPSCSYTDTEVVVGEEFDLSTFKTFQDGINKVTANAVYKEKVSNIQKVLEKKGYSCK